MHILSISHLIVGFALVFSNTSNGNNNNESNLGDDDRKSKEEGDHVRVPVINLAPWFDPAIRVTAAVSSSSSPPSSSSHRKSDDEENHLSLDHRLLSLTNEQQDIVHQIRQACREVGFFQITGGLVGSASAKTIHNNNNNNNNDDETNVDDDENDAMIQRTWKASKDFFNLPLDEKLKYTTADNTQYPYGYERSETLVRGTLLDGTDDGTPSEDDTGVAAAADLKETFSLGPPDNNGSGMPPRRWINSPNGTISSTSSVPSPSGGVSPFQTSLEAYYERMEDLALTLLEIFAIALEELPDFFRDKMDHHMSALRLVHYYPLEHLHHHSNNNNSNQTTTTTTTSSTSKLSSPPKQQQEPNPRVVRAGAHTDYGALTILAAQDEGLEVLLRDTTNTSTVHSTSGVQHQHQPQQQWVPVPLIPGAFVVNLGDLMQSWTNNEWISTMHKVVMPATEAHERRYSMAYFVNINGDTPIEPLKCCRSSEDDDGHKNGRVITAGEHLMARHLASMGIVIDDDDGEAENVSNNIFVEKGSCDASE